jgi:hypothetical protein
LFQDLGILHDRLPHCPIRKESGSPGRHSALGRSQSICEEVSGWWRARWEKAPSKGKTKRKECRQWSEDGRELGGLGRFDLA